MNGQDASTAPEELWRHSNPQSTPMWAFMQTVNQTHDLHLQTYKDLYTWSVTSTAAFWEAVWHFCGIRASQPFHNVVDEQAPMFPRPPFFSGARLNFAENLLFPTQVVDENSPALIGVTETERETVTWKELRARVAACQAGLKSIGLQPGDRVAGYVGNHANAVVAMLACASLGGVWTAVSPDSGVSMVLDRMAQIEPVVFFADNAQAYNGKTFGVLEKVREIVAQLTSLKTVVVFPAMKSGSMDVSLIQTTTSAKVYTFDQFKALSSDAHPELTFAQLEPDVPVYILYSSGTTGAPKCIVHGAIGTLIQHKKEHILHCSVTPGQRFFYFTTCTWMMWHWLVSGLAAGATLILYDGSPMRYRAPKASNSSTYESVPDDLAMSRLIDELQIHHFGTSAKYLSVLEQKDVFPKHQGLTLASLQAIYNTASPLAPSTFRYVYKAFGPDINLGSITGGTDIISLFGAANPIVPVYAGEVQCAGLGMSIRAYSEDGADITATGEAGDLVCTRAFPCQPVAFWGSSGAEKYKASYFERFTLAPSPSTSTSTSTSPPKEQAQQQQQQQQQQKPIWHHGDYVQFNTATDGLTMLGRSDGVLNPAGIRFGSAEIYSILLRQFPYEIADALCIGRRRADEADETVVLFVKMSEGHSFDAELASRIKVAIRAALSARHVPAVVDECPDIPVTVNGKKIEAAVKKIVSGAPPAKTTASVANPECLVFYEEWAKRN